jgi:uncharacterized repeat protein (TIGR01451 family)
MKKYYFLFIAFCFFGLANGQIINFPDASFKQRLVFSDVNTGVVRNFAGNFFKLDVNSDGQIQISEALLVKEMEVSGQNGSNSFTDMTGVEYFTNLTYLRCGQGNLISNLDVSNLTQLKTLICLAIPITTLNLTNLINLEELNYSSCNQLTNLIINPSNVINDINCENNNLSTLNLSIYPNLKTLNCSYNNLSSLNLTSFLNFENLSCSNNQLTSLNITGLNLKSLSCSFNINLPLINFSLYPNLEFIDCSNNPLQISVNVANCLNLQYLSCNNLQLTQLNLSNSPNIFWLSCSNNFLTTLDLNHLGNLIWLNCNNNNLNSLFIKGFLNTMLGISDVYIFGNPNLNYICCDNSQLNYFETIVINYGYICNVNSYCSFTPGGSFYTIQGKNEFDFNNNGCDLLDISLPNLKFNIADGVNFGNLISNNTGNYSIPVQAGTHTITPILANPTYFNISPTSAIITFPTTASPATQNFCITPNGNHQDLEVTLLPLNPARPGFDCRYKIVYKNKGNQIQSGAVNLTFNDAVLDFVTANPAVTSQTLNNLFWSFVDLKPFETHEIAITLNANSPMEIPALIGNDILPFTANVTSTTDETPNDNIAILNQTVVNSFDPNDKTCLEGNNIVPAKVGEYVHYMIRFENTGTFPAQNIVVKDMIDLTKFDIATLIPVSGSHDFYTRINDNKVEFIFENINLPFDNANNDAYVVFKIKTKSTLVLGNTFSNSANIYFDYNFPIVTNTATTTVANPLAVNDFEFSSYFSLYPNPAKNILNLETKKNIKISSLSIYNVLGQLVQVITSPNKTIDVSELKSGNYLVKIVTDNGSSSVKFLKE